MRELRINEITYRKIVRSFQDFRLMQLPTFKIYIKIYLNSLNQQKPYLHWPGITELMSQIIFSLVKKNEEVVIMDPTYPMYEVLCKLNQVKIKKWKFNEEWLLELMI